MTNLLATFLLLSGLLLSAFGPVARAGTAGDDAAWCSSTWKRWHGSTRRETFRRKKTALAGRFS